MDATSLLLPVSAGVLWIVLAVAAITVLKGLGAASRKADADSARRLAVGTAVMAPPPLPGMETGAHVPGSESHRVCPACLVVVAGAAACPDCGATTVATPATGARVSSAS